jgi:hypothetical protein
VYQTQPSLIAQYKTISPMIFLAAIDIDEYLSKLQSNQRTELTKKKPKLGSDPGA